MFSAHISLFDLFGIREKMRKEEKKKCPPRAIHTERHLAERHSHSHRPNFIYTLLGCPESQRRNRNRTQSLWILRWSRVFCVRIVFSLMILAKNSRRWIILSEKKQCAIIIRYFCPIPRCFDDETVSMAKLREKSILFKWKRMKKRKKKENRFRYFKGFKET